MWNVKKDCTKLYKLCPKGFNRYIVECKGKKRAPRPLSSWQDLIDTLWNVKVSTSIKFEKGSIDLIDTLWNVKSRYQNQYNHPQIDLIDTLWNVKYKETSLGDTLYTDLIDTLWNVK